MNIVVSGYYGSKNAGDEAMLAAMLEVLREFEQDLHVTVISVNPDDTKKRHGVDSVAWLDVFSIIKRIIKADLLISGGGSLLQNVTSRRSLYYYLGIIFLAKIFCRPVMLYAQGIGPICGTFARKLTNFIINNVNLITVRDHGSLEELERLGISKPDIFCTADPVLAIKPVSLDIGRNILRRYDEERYINNKDIPLIGIAVRRWHGWQHCQEELAKSVELIESKFNARIIFIPMQYPEDMKAAESITEFSNVQCKVIKEECSTSELLSLVGCMDILISIRLHALIFAGVMNTPMIGISYDPKINRFLDSIGEKPIGNLDDVTAEQILNAVEDKLKNAAAQDCELLKDLHDKALKNAQLAINLVKNK